MTEIRKGAIKAAVLAVAATLTGCDSLTERSEPVEVTLDSFNLIGSANGFDRRAVVTGNPGCTSAPVSLNGLLTSVNNYDEIDEYLETLDIRTVRYRVRNNSTPDDITGTMQMTDPATNQLTTVASISIPANTNVDNWATLPFADGGAAILQHYMDNRDSSFSYCAEGSPNSALLSLTLDLQLDLVVTVDLL